MHISLDSALGQQRRLNQVGETISSIAAPTAAYSLRSITGGDPKVVRVRRESDNDERDFTASEVSSGALVDFVNTQVTAPLDIQALTATGRNGDFLIAKAAYSLRSLGTRQATVSATGDTVARADGKYVCQVRRSSDDALKSFTADEITDGTLLSFVNEIQTLGTVSNSVGNNDFVLTNASNTGFTATLSSGTGVCGWAFTAKSGDKVTVSFDAVVRGGSPQFLPRRATALSGSNLATVVSDSALNVTTGSFSFEFTYNSDDAGSLTFSEGDAGSDFDISNFQVTVFKGAGHVKTWYDQSVTTQAGDTATGNHATQATAANQPKIVSAGSLVVDSSGVPELEFDGSDDVLSAGTGFASSSKTIFCVNNPDSLSSNGLFAFGSSQTDRFFAQYTSNLIRTEINGAQAGVSAATQKNLTTNLHTTDISVGLNGGSFTTTSASFSGVSASAELKIGQRFGTAFTDNFDGTIQEFIAYNSDQTDNRTAIEANIGEHYSISGIPAFDNSVNGFVETWYDQSGNGNNATQATSGSQPKIVDAGSLLTAGVTFDGGDSLSVSDPVITASSSGTYSAFSVQTVATSEAGYLYGNASTSNGSSFYALVDKFTSTNQTSTSLDNISRSSGQNLLSAVYDNGDAGLLVNGTGTMTDAGTYTFSAGTSDFVIGNRNGGTVAATFLTGSINEIIVYNSNQSSNRTALENEIISHYGIS